MPSSKSRQALLVSYAGDSSYMCALPVSLLAAAAACQLACFTNQQAPLAPAPPPVCLRLTSTRLLLTLHLVVTACRTAVKMDVGGPDTRCTSLLGHVIDIHMRDMILDGTLQKLRDKHTASSHDTGFACPPPGGDPRTAFSMEVGAHVAVPPVYGPERFPAWTRPASTPLIGRSCLAAAADAKCSHTGAHWCKIAVEAC